MWVRVIGVDEEFRLRRGDVSLTGIFFETDKQIGPPGSVQTVILQPYSRAREVEVLARVVRLVAIQDIWAGPGIAGVALEFMADGDDKRQIVEALVREMVGSRANLTTQEGATSAPAIVLHRLSNEGMILETDWEVSVGETIRLEIQAPASGRRLRIQGYVLDANPIAAATTNRYSVSVEFDHQRQNSIPSDHLSIEGVSLGDAINVLLEETVLTTPPGPRSQAQTLNGSLNRIQLPSLLGFIAIERMTGVLQVIRDTQQARVFMLNGCVFDATGNTSDEPMKVLQEIIAWKSGEFEFTAQSVECADRLGLTTTQLLLELARTEDHKGS